MKKGKNSGDKGENGKALWDYVTRGIRAYNKPPAPKAEIRKVASATRPLSAAPRHVPPPISKEAIPKGFDRATETKLRRGQLSLEGRLDLHGMSQAEAFEALCAFIQAAVARKKRTVLVITGKGERGEGILKRKMPLWLEEPALAPYIVAMTPAQPKDGGSGAFYLRLRKPALTKR